jgi:hypothetical protein
MRNVSGNCYRENQNTHIFCSVPFIKKPCLLSDNVEKLSRVLATDDNMAQAHCVMDT